ncbi:MAG TPA: nucleotidyltransferase domain-containing protein [Candidatus Polarisedimenticolia bacterium]|nr:nucleotidyltransferase domain-containing protein [Candidatus Polarisedimenticolia bacterium]
MTKEQALQRPELRGLLEGLQRALGTRLEAVVLYGSAARGDFREGTSDLNVAVVVAALDPATLEALTRPVLAWVKAKETPPRLLTRGLLAASLDVFPLEILDLRTHHVALHGSDPFAGLVIRTEALRMQCERELREKLMRLREGYVTAHATKGGLRALLVDSYTSFTALFRGCLHLLGAAVPRAADEAAAAFCARAGIDAAPFLEVGRLRDGGSASAGDLKTVFSGYYDALTRAADLVDAFVPAQGGETR